MERTIYLSRYQVAGDALQHPIRRSAGAVTYQAVDLESGGEVALRVIPTEGLPAETRAEMEREAEAALQLKHLNLPVLHAFGVEDEHLVYAFESVDGTAAEEWVQSHGPMPLGPVLRIALQVTGALGAAAFHRLLHRAISPRHIVLVPGQTAEGDWPLVKITGLIGNAPLGAAGLARTEESTTAMSYASPEQVHRGTVTFESEIYSLGATLWFLLSGETPVAGAELSRRKGLPKQFMQLLDEMLALAPEERPHDPIIFQERLQQCLEGVERREELGRKLGVPLVATVAAPVAPRAPRRPLPWKPLAIAALALGLGVLLISLFPRADRPGRLLANWGKPKPLGVPIGVSEPASSVIAPPKVTSEPAPAPVVVYRSPAADEIEETPAPAAQATPAPVVVAQAEPPRVAIPEATAPSVAMESEPLPPAEGPTDESSPPVFAAQEPEVAPPVLAEATPLPAATPLPVEPTPVVIAEEPVNEPIIENLPVRKALPAPAATPERRRVAQSSSSSRPTRIAQREVRPAEPADGSIPGLPKRSRRARFVGTAPDGSLIFELPSAKQGFVKPRR